MIRAALLVLALSACGAPPAPVSTAVGPPVALPHPPAPAPDAGPPRFVGDWAPAEGSCARPWQFRADGLSTPGHVACAFTEVTPAPGGYDIAATRTAEAPPAPYHIEIRFAESARAMLVSGGPMNAAALIACPSGPRKALASPGPHCYISTSKTGSQQRAGAARMADVFISYAREDKARAEQVARGLQGAGIDVFWDSEIPPGQTWADYIEGKLSQCKAVIVLWSENSTRSQWVREEARMGRDRGKLIPVQLDASPAPFGFGEVQAANLTNWTGEAGHPEWERTLAAVRAIVSGQGQPAPPRPQTAAQSTIQPAYAPPAADAAKKPWFQNVWVLAGGGVLAVLVVLGVIGAMSGTTQSTPPVDPAQQHAIVGPQQPDQPQVNYQQQLQVQLAEVGGYMAQEGFQPVGQPFMSGLAQGANQFVPVELHQGFDYRIVAVCDQDCSDIDLRLNDQNNNEVAADVAMDDRPIVQVTPRWTGPFQLNVVMATCTVAPCYFAAQLYGRQAQQ